jgi:hypothetical protein
LIAYDQAVPQEKADVFRALHSPILVGVSLVSLSLTAQTPNPLQSLVGQEVTLKIDMPGTQRGVDLNFANDNPMNWKDYANRLKSNGTAIQKGSTARVTAVVVKNDRIEFQLDGGGFGTFFDDSDTTVTPKTVDKSSYEKDLEKQISNTSDPDKKRQLQKDLDRERARRERQESDARAAAQVASQIKAQQVADKRLGGGSRFNLRWKGSIPADQLNPDAVEKLLGEYVGFGGSQQAAAAAPPAANTVAAAAVPATAHLQRGMKMADVTTLFGQGHKVSESVSSDGLKTQVFEYSTGDRLVNVTYVEGLVVRYSISSN